jgi:hypothetical protein
VKVTPKAGTAITETDTVTNKLLPVSTVTYPTDGSTVAVSSPTLTWTAVAGATHYRIFLSNGTLDEPVYGWWESQMRTDFTSFKMPVGDLKPNTMYYLRIEARAGSQDLDQRSRSDFVKFTTGSW